ncbi:MAG TPA: inorganic phosphate transporter, partial [Candidatus Binatus sp.]|nr:inorganic phosphate transporter [Candidatus Binatus sp.]
LVSAGAIFGAPISTTHVTSGANAGARGGKKEVLFRVMKQIILSWAVTFPVAGLFAILASQYIVPILP